MDAEDPYFAALKLFLVFGPLLGFAVLELILLRRDKRRAVSATGVGERDRSAAPPHHHAAVPFRPGAVRVSDKRRLRGVSTR